MESWRQIANIYKNDRKKQMKQVRTGRDKRRSTAPSFGGTIPHMPVASSRPGDDAQDNSRQHRIFARHPFYRDPNTISMGARSCKLSCPSLLRAKLPSREPASTGGIAFSSTRTLDHQRPTANARRLQLRLNWFRMSLVATARYAVNISFIRYRYI